MTAKRAVSPLRQAASVAELQLPIPLTGLPATTPFTRYVLDNLNLQNGEYKMLAMSFAPQIQMDCEAKVLDFDDYYHLLGHGNKAHAVRTLKRTISEDGILSTKSGENSMGRPRDVYLVSVNQMEEVLLASNAEGVLPNHEPMRVVASAKCVDSKLIEDVMHRIFRDYRTNDKLEWFDTNLKSMNSVLKFVIEMIDGLNQVDHDEVCISDHLDQITMLMKEKVLHLPPHAYAKKSEVAEEAEQLTNEIHPSNVSPVKAFIEDHLCLSRDKRDPRYHHKATSLYNHYVTTIPSGHQALSSNEFFKNTKIILKDNYKNAGSKRDRRYEGIELV